MDGPMFRSRIRQLRASAKHLAEQIDSLETDVLADGEPESVQETYGVVSTMGEFVEPSRRTR